MSRSKKQKAKKYSKKLFKGTGILEPANIQSGKTAYATGVELLGVTGTVPSGYIPKNYMSPLAKMAATAPEVIIGGYRFVRADKE